MHQQGKKHQETGIDAISAPTGKGTSVNKHLMLPSVHQQAKKHKGTSKQWSHQCTNSERNIRKLANSDIFCAPTAKKHMGTIKQLSHQCTISERNIREQTGHKARLSSVPSFPTFSLVFLNVLLVFASFV